MYTWNILDDMFSMRALMERAFGEVSGGREGGSPPINVSETEASSQVQALVPGLTQEEIDITFEKGVLTIASAECKKDSEKKPEDHSIREEHCQSSFRRSLRFSRDIEHDSISAHLENGVLTINLPHRPESAPRKIEVG